VERPLRRGLRSMDTGTSSDKAFGEFDRSIWPGTSWKEDKITFDDRIGDLSYLNANTVT
jgi:hypothetical protein